MAGGRGKTALCLDKVLYRKPSRGMASEKVHRAGHFLGRPGQLIGAGKIEGSLHVLIAFLAGFIGHEHIRRGLKGALPGATKIIIAQRIASIVSCDRILVLDEGKLSDFGTHEELLARSQIYRDVYDSQMKQEVSADAES